VSGLVSAPVNQLSGTLNGFLGGTSASGSASVSTGGGLLGLNFGLF
jgi:hypothetical protein